MIGGSIGVDTFAVFFVELSAWTRTGTHLTSYFTLVIRAPGRALSISCCLWDFVDPPD